MNSEEVIIVPDIKDAITKGPLTGAERKVLAALENNCQWTSSDTLEDLADLARLCANRSSIGSPVPLDNPGEAKPLTLDSSFLVNPRVWFPVKKQKTMTLKTVRSALYSLALSDWIWTYALGDQLYWASHKGKKYLAAEIQRKIKKLPVQDKEHCFFHELTPEELANRLGG